MKICLKYVIGILVSTTYLLVCCNSLFGLQKNIGYLRPTNRPVAERSRFCGAHAVWHALNLFGKKVDIDAIICEMKVDKQGYSTMCDLVRALKHHGINAKAVKLNVDKTCSFSRPFIPYILDQSKDTIGHFFVCVPIGNGKAIIMDGIEKPNLFSMENLSLPALKASWDGTAIILPPLNKEYEVNSIIKVTSMLVVFILLLIIWRLHFLRNIRNGGGKNVLINLK